MIKNKNDSGKVRVRFAPSPTGPLHIGGVRTALYNYLFAKKNGGDFILRIEDTDEKRFVPGAEEYIRESLAWLGISPTEGEGYGGDKGPYKQSDRKHMYIEYAHRLVESGHAYYAFDTAEDLAKVRSEFSGKGEFKYDHITRSTLKNSLVLAASVVEEKIASGDPYVIRAKIERNESVRFHDSVRGWVVVNTNDLDDKVIMKSTGMPTYHLANIVDDHLMEITHVIRGEEWLPSAPLHVLLYTWLGWDVPDFVHCPLIMGPSGKLSKRDGDKYGFPVFPLEWTDPVSGDVSRGYREDGFLPEALLNIVALLGWNPGHNVEFMSLADMEDTFAIDRIQKSGAKFDLTKAEWMNREHMKKCDNIVLAETLMDDVTRNTPTFFTYDYVAKVCGLLKERTMYVKKLWEDGKYFFIRPDYDYLVTIITPDHIAFLNDIATRLNDADAEHFDHEGIKPIFDASIAATGIKPRDAGAALRGAICDNKVGPSIFDIMNLFGKAETMVRVSNACLITTEKAES